MFKRVIAFFIWLTVTPSLSISQSNDFWVQIEAYPNESEAETAASVYGAKIDDVSALSIGRGWYVIAIGPLEENDAERQLFDLRTSEIIPLYSFISRGKNYAEKIWPKSIKDSVTNIQALKNDSTFEGTAKIVLSSKADETLEEASDTEDLLTQDEKKHLQLALKSAGFYFSSIDGSFGSQTREAMSAWQNAENVLVTGVLTTAQREYLLQQNNRILKTLGIQRVTDFETGVAINLPLAIVGFTKYSPPLAHFTSRKGTQHAAYVISKSGDENDLGEIYEALQSLDIMPKASLGSLKSNQFEITAQNDEIITYAQAELLDGNIKGYMLVWPTNDGSRRDGLLHNMKTSFERFEGVLKPNIGDAKNEDLDLLFGLDTKKPEFVRSGIFISANGHIVTEAFGINACERITVENNYEARLVNIDDSGTLALLEVKEKIVPAAVAEFPSLTDHRGDQVLGAGYSYGGRLPQPSVMKGKIEEFKSLDGQSGYVRLSMSILPSDIGGPILNRFGSLSGLLAIKSKNGRSLPENVAHAIKPNKIANFLNSEGLTLYHKNSEQLMSDFGLARKARAITGLISCWKN
ncbi:MAG: hypothetical protein CML56_07255 [Rhodobacteraceae bacterium]|nr:hypothetical protein [Paracoccaceae bacterium]